MKTITPKLFEDFLKKEINKLLPNHPAADVYDWALFPAGKLFRPMLSIALAEDLNPHLFNDDGNIIDTNFYYFGCALECHHSYSLIHDDLPSMDNDDFRRGKESTHKKYGEWQAILTGDGLLNISYEFLTKLKCQDSERFHELLKLFSRTMGPKGLIHGQVLDLSTEMALNFKNTILTHQLKTARLIQLSLVGTAFLTVPTNRKLEKKLWRLGENIGVLFQLLDDLTELSAQKLSAHELSVNPWPKFMNETHSETLRRLNVLTQILKELQIKNTQKMLSHYFQKVREDLNSHQKNISMHLNGKLDLTPVMTALDGLSSLN